MLLKLEVFDLPNQCLSLYAGGYSNVKQMVGSHFSRSVKDIRNHCDHWQICVGWPSWKTDKKSVEVTTGQVCQRKMIERDIILRQAFGDIDGALM